MRFLKLLSLSLLLFSSACRHSTNESTTKDLGDAKSIVRIGDNAWNVTCVDGAKESRTTEQVQTENYCKAVPIKMISSVTEIISLVSQDATTVIANTSGMFLKFNLKERNGAPELINVPFLSNDLTEYRAPVMDSSDGSVFFLSKVWDRGRDSNKWFLINRMTLNDNTPAFDRIPSPETSMGGGFLEKVVMDEILALGKERVLSGSYVKSGSDGSFYHFRMTDFASRESKTLASYSGKEPRKVFLASTANGTLVATHPYKYALLIFSGENGRSQKELKLDFTPGAVAAVSGDEVVVFGNRFQDGVLRSEFYTLRFTDETPVPKKFAAPSNDTTSPNISSPLFIHVVKDKGFIYQSASGTIYFQSFDPAAPLVTLATGVHSAKATVTPENELVYVVRRGERQGFNYEVWRVNLKEKLHL